MERRRAIRAVLVAGVALPLLLAGGFMAAVLLTPLPSPQNPEATEILDANGARVTRLFTENRVELPVVDMPESLLNAIVAIEDDRFYQHRGIDPTGIARAFVRNVQAGRVVQGGSTLTQQLAKNLYLGHERTVTRKVREAVLTLKLEASYSKKEILGMYWNTIYLGRGTYGVQVASQTYFGKDARKLTLSETAVLAALPQSPEYYSKPENAEALQKRRDRVLEKMAAAGYITDEEAEEASAGEVRLTEGGKGQAAGGQDAPYFVDYVMRELRERYPAVARDLNQGGYRIQTTLNLGMQRAANQAIESAATNIGRDRQAALVALDPDTGYIRAFVGGRDEAVERNRVLERQQPGSAFKPFVYAVGLETRAYTALSTQLDAPAEFPGSREGAPYRPQNHNGRYSYKPATMRQALRQSLNVVTVQWINTLKPPAVIDLARRMGIGSKLPANLTIALGSAEVTPLELTRAYAPLANGGYAVKPIAILRITDRNDNVIAEERPTRSQVVDSGVAFIVTDMLKEVVGPNGTAAVVSGYLGGRPAAGKTGTSDESRDLWFVGYTPDLVASVWVGSDDNSPGRGDGGSVAAPIWADFASRALVKAKFRGWTPPGGVEQREICTETGLLANPTCPTTREWFLAGTAPKEVDPTVYFEEAPGADVAVPPPEVGVPELKVAPLEPKVVPLEPKVAPLEPKVVPLEPKVAPLEPKLVPPQLPGADTGIPGFEPLLPELP